jgi:hypothetical protein
MAENGNDKITVIPVSDFPELYNISAIGINVFYESPDTPFEYLCETSFLMNLFEKIKVFMKDKFYEYNFYVYSYGWKQDHLPNSVFHEYEKRKILMYISDESGNVPYYLAPYYYCIFKIHLQLDKFLVDNIFNFPLGCEKHIPKQRYKNINERKYSVFFSGNLNNNRLPLYLYLIFGKIPSAIIRKGIKVLIHIVFFKKVLVLLRFDSKFPNAYIRFTKGFKQGLTAEKYGEIIGDSKIVLCPKGFNLPECFRHYEAMRAGCVIISEKLPPTYFYKDSPIIQISDWKKGLKIADELINNKTELEKLSKMTIDWWENRCSENATAQYIIKCIESIENKKNGT